MIEIKMPNNEIKTFKQGNPIVIVGSNGSGKTRLSVKLEELNDGKYMNSNSTSQFLVHRLSAQKSLQMSEDIIIKGLEISEREHYYGGNTANCFKFGYKYQSNPFGILINDFDKVLSLFFAQNSQIVEEYHNSCLVADKDGYTLPPPIRSLKSQAEEIWDYLLPNRKISFSGNQVKTKYEQIEYPGKDMSDGERVILYMILQVLTVKPKSLIIVDEPELHIHKAIVNKLWDKLESVRNDCVFMYITHELDFAVSRNSDEILWVKSYYGQNIWDYEFLQIDDYSDIPEGLIMEVVGTQKNIIFVEGTKDSLDYMIYQEIYKDMNYHVIPCGGCSQVINNVKAKNGYSKFSHTKAYGIIDRDFRTDEELKTLEKDGIFSLGVAEVENLFIVPELLIFMEKQLGCMEGTHLHAIELIKTIFDSKIESQINEMFVKEIKHKLNLLSIDRNPDFSAIENSIFNSINPESIESIYSVVKSKFLDVSDYKEIVRIFNHKDLVKSIDSKFDLSKGGYKRKIIQLLKESTKAKEEITDSLKSYIPNFE